MFKLRDKKIFEKKGERRGLTRLDIKNRRNAREKHVLGVVSDVSTCIPATDSKGRDDVGRTCEYGVCKVCNE